MIDVPATVSQRLVSRGPACLVALVAVLTGLLSRPAAGQAEGAHTALRERGNTTVFDCERPAANAFWFTIRQGPGELALWLPPEFQRPYVVLSQDFDRSGRVFREGDVTIELRDGSAELSIGNEQFPHCVENPVRTVWEHAKLAGIDFRAAGTNPDWYLEIRGGGDIVLASVVDDLRVTVPTPEPETDANGSVYRAAASVGELTVRIGGSSCATPDGDEITGTSVVVTVADSTFAGCGRPLH